MVPRIFHLKVVLELSENLEEFRHSTFFNALPIISNYRLKNHVVWKILYRVLKLGRDGNGPLSLIIFDCVLDNIEDDQLVEPPISLHGGTIEVFLFDSNRHLFLLYLVLEWLEYLLNEFLGLDGAHLSND